MSNRNEIFKVENRVAIHEAGHAVIAWAMRAHCDPQAFEGIFQIFYFVDSFGGSCHFKPSRATNFNTVVERQRNPKQAATDLAINMAGCSTYCAYLDPKGDPAYPINDIRLYLSNVIENGGQGRDHDFRYFSDIARFDLGIEIDKIGEFALIFQDSLVQLLMEKSVRDGIGELVKNLLSLNPGVNSLNVKEIRAIEALILPSLLSKQVAKSSKAILAVCRSYYI